jgi:ATP-dependent DNA ligase
METFGLPELFKYGARGEMRTWKVYFDGFDIVTVSGVVGGKMVERPTEVVPKAKRNTHQQAEQEAKSRHKKKKDEGYKENIDEETDEMPHPMEGKIFEERLITYPILVQCKADGVRMICRQRDGILEATSRRKQEIKFLETLKEEISTYLNGSDIILDGELYSLTLPFHKLSGIERKKNEKSEHEDEICYLIFDQMLPNAETEERLNGIGAPIHSWGEEVKGKKVIDGKGTDLSPFLKKISPHLFIMRNWIISDETELQEVEELAAELGFEGLMVRHLTGKYVYYKNSRCPNLLKIKKYFDAEGEIVGFGEGTGTEKGKVIWLVKLLADEIKGVQIAAGEVIKMRPQGDFDDREGWFENGDQYIGKIVTYKCLQINEDTGIPREPCVLRFKE